MLNPCTGLVPIAATFQGRGAARGLGLGVGLACAQVLALPLTCGVTTGNFPPSLALGLLVGKRG